MRLHVGKAVTHSVKPWAGGLGSGTFPYMEIEPSQPDGRIALFGNTFLCSRSDVYFVLPNCVLYGLWLTHAVSIPQGE